MANAKIVAQYIENGKRLTLLKGKKPIVKNWGERDIGRGDLLAHTGNVGWVIGNDNLVIDVDPKNGGGESFDKLLIFLQIAQPGLDLQPTVQTPSGGFHVYLQIEQRQQGAKLRKSLSKDYPGIDFLTKGSQCVIPSSTTSQGDYRWAEGICEFTQSACPDCLIELLQHAVVTDSELGDFDGMLSEQSSQWPQDKVVTMLQKLDPSMTNHDWVKVGMALHDWDYIEGLEVWEQWSQGGDNYVEGDTSARWKSFTSGGGVTLGTLFHMVKETLYDEATDEVNQYIDQIKTASEKTIEFDILPKLRNLEFSKINKEKIVKAIQDRVKEISGVRMPVASVRSMVESAALMSDQVTKESDPPTWCKDWLYVNSHAAFINLDTFSLHKSESFNICNGKNVPEYEGGGKPSAVKFISDSGYIDKVDYIAYLPSHSEVICTIDGSKILNCFNPKTIPIESQKFTREGLKAVELIENHIKFIFSTEENCKIFTQWLAHQVQYPGRQLLWAPVIQSIQGVGKSFFGELLRVCLGDKNVGTVSTSQVVNSFNGWATNVVVNILEELRVVGHNRYDAVNSLKPLITDRMIQINDKGVKQYMTYNTTNYICFTNYKDSLPLEIDDRRWWVVFAPILSLTNLRSYVGEDASTYFPKLFESTRTYGGEVRKWLLEYPIRKEFMATRQAPMTNYKLAMVATEEAGVEGLTELRELIAKGGKFFNEDVVSSSDLFEALLFEHPEIDLKTTKKHILLKKLGYVSSSFPIKIGGKTRRLWSRTPLSNCELRELLVDL